MHGLSGQGISLNLLGRCNANPVQKDYAASVLAFLHHFGYDVEKVNGPKVHSLYNVITMQKDVHDWFDHLVMWFESTVGATVINYACSNITSKLRGLITATVYKLSAKATRYLAR
jgi:hypothetical protein